MNKSELKVLFKNAKLTGERYIGVKIETEGSSQPEVIIIQKEDFDRKLEYYVNECDFAFHTDSDTVIVNEGVLIYRITGVASGNKFEDIEFQLMSVGIGWKKPISDAIDRSYNKMIAETPPSSEEERVHCETVKEAVKGMFLNAGRSAAEARFIFDNIEKYEELFDICMNGDDMQFRKGLVEIQRMQNERMLKDDGVS